MSYIRKIEYEIIPEESFKVIRKCSHCGAKTCFNNTGKFRVNANGNKLDVWLIYQCEKCKHTFNLTIYERKKPSSIPADEYKCFLSNDENLAKTCGTNLQLFKQNKAEVDIQNVKYHYQKRLEHNGHDSRDGRIMIIIHNPSCLKIRPEKQIAETLGLSTNYVKKLLDREVINTNFVSPQLISVNVHNHIWEEVSYIDDIN